MVKRYDFETNDATGEAVIIERQNGDYVDAHEYDELQDEVTRLRAIIKDATDILRDA